MDGTLFARMSSMFKNSSRSACPQKKLIEEVLETRFHVRKNVVALLQDVIAYFECDRWLVYQVAERVGIADIQMLLRTLSPPYRNRVLFLYALCSIQISKTIQVTAELIECIQILSEPFLYGSQIGSTFGNSYWLLRELSCDQHKIWPFCKLTPAAPPPATGLWICTVLHVVHANCPHLWCIIYLGIHHIYADDSSISFFK